MRTPLNTERLRRHKCQFFIREADRAVKTAVWLSVTFVLVLIGFSGPSGNLRLPGPMGWIYITVVAIISAAASPRSSGLMKNPEGKIPLHSDWPGKGRREPISNRTLTSPLGHLILST